MVLGGLVLVGLVWTWTTTQERIRQEWLFQETEPTEVRQEGQFQELTPQRSLTPVLLTQQFIDGKELDGPPHPWDDGPDRSPKW